MKKDKKVSDKVSFKEAFQLNKKVFLLLWEKYPKMFISSIVCALFGSLTPYVGIYLSAQIINEISGNRNKEKLMQLVFITLISTVIFSMLNAGLGRWKNCQHRLFWYRCNRIYAEKQLSMDFCIVDDSHTHDLKSQIRQAENWSGWGIIRFKGNFESLLNSSISIFGAVALTVTLFTLRVPDNMGNLTILNNPLCVILIIAVMLAVTFISPILSNKAESYWAKYSDSAKFGNRCFSFFGFFAHHNWRGLDIRMYRQENLCTKYMMMDMSFSPKSKIAQYSRGPMGLMSALSAIVSRIFTAIVYIFVCLKSWGGAFGVGSVTQYIGAISSLSGSVSSLISTLGSMHNNAVFLRTTFEFLNMPNVMYQGSLTVEKRKDRSYEVEFRNVSFKYPKSDEYALKNVSMKFKIGQRLAVVGMNGSGKTTFIKLLCRLYDPTEGEILLNGIDIRKYNYNEYISIFSVVFQDFKLFSFSLGQNVSASVNFDKDRVIRCLDEAGFTARLSEMPNGIETNIYKDFDEKGVEVSGGEAQKIAIARTLYKNAPFIILDEPTAALDPIAEFEVYSKFNEIVGDKTAIYISHRLSSCRFCDEIAVFHGGELAQQGSHESLLNDESGKYHELWHAQAQYYVEHNINF